MPKRPSKQSTHNNTTLTRKTPKAWNNSSGRNSRPRLSSRTLWAIAPIKYPRRTSACPNYLSPCKCVKKKLGSRIGGSIKQVWRTCFCTYVAPMKVTIRKESEEGREAIFIFIFIFCFFIFSRFIYLFLYYVLIFCLRIVGISIIYY